MMLIARAHLCHVVCESHFWIKACRKMTKYSTVDTFFLLFLHSSKCQTPLCFAIVSHKSSFVKGVDVTKKTNPSRGTSFLLGLFYLLIYNDAQLSCVFERKKSCFVRSKCFSYPSSVRSLDLPYSRKIFDYLDIIPTWPHSRSCSISIHLFLLVAGLALTI